MKQLKLLIKNQGDQWLVCVCVKNNLIFFLCRALAMKESDLDQWKREIEADQTYS
jgi:hypothetical protein